MLKIQELGLTTSIFNYLPLVADRLVLGKPSGRAEREIISYADRWFQATASRIILQKNES